MDTKELRELYRSSFDDSNEYIDFFFNEELKEENILTYYEDEKLVSAAYIVEKPAVMFKEKIIFPYLSAVSTRADMRGKGKIANVIEKSFQVLRDRNCYITGLVPLNYNFYKRFGYCDMTFFEQKIINGGINFESRSACEKDFPSVINIAKIMSQRFENYLELDEYALMLKIDEYKANSHPCTILSKDGKDFAFAFIEKNYLDYYGSLDMNLLECAENFKGCKYNDFSSFTAPFLQSRILDIKKYLQRYIFPQNINKIFKIGIVDKYIKDNNINVEVAISNGKAFISDCRADAVKKIFDISEITDILFNKIAKIKNYFPDRY